jgi:hypothetical protein
MTMARKTYGRTKGVVGACALVMFLTVSWYHVALLQAFTESSELLLKSAEMKDRAAVALIEH